LPGEGNFLVFCNAQNLFELTPQSYIIEINPYLNSAGTNTGHFVNPPEAGYTIVNSPDANLMKEKKNVSKQIVWTYSSKNNTSFFSTIGSSAQRLANGNTLVCSMNDGHFFEVYPSDTSIVWEYINPMTRNGIKKVKVDNYPTYNGVFRAYMYASDHPALVGQNLTPGNTMTGQTPNYYKPEDLTAVKESESYMEPIDILRQNYPNPFAYSTTIDFEITELKRVNITVFDFSGNYVKTLVDADYSKGNYSTTWNATNTGGSLVANGIYFYILKADNRQLSKKMILVK